MCLSYFWTRTLSILKFRNAENLGPLGSPPWKSLSTPGYPGQCKDGTKIRAIFPISIIRAMHLLTATSRGGVGDNSLAPLKHSKAFSQHITSRLRRTSFRHLKLAILWTIAALCDDVRYELKHRRYSN
jgi:hypothetical protein